MRYLVVVLFTDVDLFTMVVRHFVCALIRMYCMGSRVRMCVPRVLCVCVCAL